MNKINASKIAKIALAIMLVIVVAGAIVFEICKLNYGADIKGCVEITVELDEDSINDKVVNAYKEDIIEILEKNGFEFAKTTRIQESSDSFATIVFSVKTSNADKTITKLEDKFSTDLKAYLTSKYDGYTDEDFADNVQISEIGGAYGTELVKGVLWGSLIMVAAITLYCFLRFKWASGFTAFLSAVLDLALLLAILAITRIRVDALSVNVIWICLLYSLLLSLISFFVLKKNSKIKIADEQTIKDRVYSSAYESGKMNFILSVALIVMLALAIIFVPFEIKLILIHVMLAVVVGGADAILVKPVLRYWLSKIKKNKKKA